jgi:gliding-associated putative ABC transporter substrate-binding component GldG
MNKKDSLFYFVSLGIGLVLLNLILKHYFFRIDLTEEKRFTISEASKKLLKNLEQPVYVEVFLDGDLPPAFIRLKRSIHEILEECKQYAGKKLQYKFTDPAAVSNEKTRAQFYYSLAQKGIQPTNIFLKEGDRRVEKLIFPGAVISTGAREVGILLLKGSSASSPEEIIDQSIENLEYEFISSIKSLGYIKKKKVAIIQHNEQPSPVDSIQTLDLFSELKSLYEVQKINLKNYHSLNEWDVVMVVNPQKEFTDEDKIKIDQYVVNGGKMLFFVDAVKINMDSIGENGTVSLPLDLNLDDLFFKWGIRINKVLVQDLNCAPIPVNVGNLGDKPQIKLLPWPYFPLFNTYGKHPIVRNMDAIYGKFVSVIDTVMARGITKTPLVFTSKYSKIVGPPSLVSLNEIRNKLEAENFNKSNLIVACLLEGKFKSLYANRPLFLEKYPNLVNENKNAKIIVFSDSDIPLSDVEIRKAQIIPMGQHTFLNKKYANKDFVINSLTYLLDEDGLILTRNKELTVRPLDRFKIKSERNKWQFINVVLPLIFLAMVGLIWNFGRNRKNKTINIGQKA